MAAKRNKRPTGNKAEPKPPQRTPRAQPADKPLQAHPRKPKRPAGYVEEEPHATPAENAGE